MRETERIRNSVILGGIIVLYTGLIMINWATGRHILDFADDQWIGMVFNTALLFAALTAASLLKCFGGAAKSRIGDLIALGVVLFCAAAMLQYTTGWDFGIDQMFIKDPEGHIYSSRPGSMAPMTGVNFILIAGILLLHDRMDRSRFRHIAQFLLVIVFSTSIFILAGRMLGSPELGNIPGQTSMAATTAAVFILQILLCYLVYPELILDRFQDSANFRMLIRRGIPLLVAVPILMQLLIFGMESMAGHSEAMGHSLYVAMFIVSSVVGLIYLAGLVYAGDMKAREANEKYNRFFSLSKDFLMIIRPDGQAEAINDIWSEKLGWTMEELLSQKMENFVYPSERRHLPTYTDRINQEDNRAVQRIGITTKAGELRMVEWDSSKDPTTQLVYCIGRDITLQHEIEYRQTQARTMAEEASRAKSDFLANMSHELRTPLNSIIGFTEVLGDRLYGDLNDRQQEYIGYIDQSARHLLNLINDVLDLSKIESGKMVLDLQCCSMRQLVESALMMFREKSYRCGIILSASFERDHNYMVEVDERKVKQILYNLLSNGVKFTPSSGRVTVIVGELISEDQRFLTLAVEDTGEGISEEQQALLFTKFHQAETVYDKVHEGTGLGLALTKELVELHGGTIHVQSRPGEGSCFSVHLPINMPFGEEMLHVSENIDSRR